MPPASSGQDLIENPSVNICQAEMASLIFPGQPFVIKAEAVQNGRIEIVDLDWVPHDVVAEVVGFTDSHSRLDPTTSQQRGWWSRP